MQVQDIMSADVEVEERMAAKKLRHISVLEQGEIVGIVTQRDLFKAAMSSTWAMAKKRRRRTSRAYV